MKKLMEGWRIFEKQALKEQDDWYSEIHETLADKKFAEREDTKASRAKEVDHETLEVDGIDASDYPDFADAYFSYGKYTDGTEMTDDELYQLADEDPGLLNDMVQHFIH